MLKNLIEGLFSTLEFGPQFLIELIVLVALLEFIRMMFDFFGGGRW